MSPTKFLPSTTSPHLISSTMQHKPSANINNNNNNNGIYPNHNNVYNNNYQHNTNFLTTTSTWNSYSNKDINNNDSNNKLHFVAQAYKTTIYRRRNQGTYRIDGVQMSTSSTITLNNNNNNNNATTSIINNNTGNTNNTLQPAQLNGKLSTSLLSNSLNTPSTSGSKKKKKARNLKTKSMLSTSREWYV
ncbi:hypothetical protein HELRODRAFT_161582 [Helobdella robusta]|uniref:Uncharacterized protein n=1 Tax=Helobdella robusta TaxID=6412 RepID=T1ERN3_HELRO|nr:hypothetical protein HELRODRAFT_161582 [Helobdella robusta]ESO02327.1 hypothetical protein HELRODRAFT_161582 [Helobdella robusta]